MTSKTEIKTLVLSLLTTIALSAGLGIRLLDILPENFFSSNASDEADTNYQVVAIDTSENPLTFTELANSGTVPTGNWFYGGSTTWAAIREMTEQPINQAIPDFQISYIQDSVKPPSSGNGIDMLIDGKISFAQSSRPIQEDEFAAAAQQGFQLRQIPIAYDAIAVVVHPSLPVDGLTITQLIAIYTGQVTNWQALGGPNLAIKPYTAPFNSGAPTILKKDFFVEGQEFGENVVPIDTPSEAIQLINHAPEAEQGAIYLASARNLIGQCSVKPLAIARESDNFIPPYAGDLVPPENCPEQRNQINEATIRSGQYPLTRRLFVIFKQDDSIDQASGEAYVDLLLTREGQSLIREAGFVPLVEF